MKVPFFDPKRHFATHREEILDRVIKTFESGALINGPQVENFEKQFSAYCRQNHCIASSNGTSALFTALKCLGVDTGDTVITSAVSALPTASAISQTGAQPTFIDINAQFQIDADKIETAISPTTKAIVVPHLFGYEADIKRIRTICDRHNLMLIEDCAQAVGTNAGQYGDISVYSFYPTKNLGAYGDAGAIVTSNDTYAQWCTDFSKCGKGEMHGINSRMDAIQASFLLQQLDQLEKALSRRKQIASAYIEGLKEIKALTIPTLPLPYHLFVIQTERRDELQKYLSSQGIDTLIHYDYILPELPAYGGSSSAYPIATRYKNETLSLPLFPELTDEEVQFVIEKTNSFFVN